MHRLQSVDDGHSGQRQQRVADFCPIGLVCSHWRTSIQQQARGHHAGAAQLLMGGSGDEARTEDIAAGRREACNHSPGLPRLMWSGQMFSSRSFARAAASCSAFQHKQ